MAGIGDRFHRELLGADLIQVEGLEGAACGPHVKHLAALALRAARALPGPGALSYWPPV